MLVPASDATDVEDILWNVRRFFYHHDVGTGQTRFLLVILPDGTRADARIEDFCKNIGVVCHFCSPLYETSSDWMAKEKYLKNVANEIKARVMECNILSDTYEDLNIIDEVAEYFSFDDEMREDGYSYKEMGEDDGYNYKEMESVQLSSSHNESGEYSSEEKNPEASHISGPPDTEEGEQQLLPAEGFTTIADAIPQAKSANIKPWVCLNFSRISGKESLEFVSKLGTLCVSIGMDLKPEPTLMFRISASHDTDVGTTLWTVFKFFDHYEIGKGEKLVLVIMPEARYSHEDIKRSCGNLGLVCQFCLPQHARKARMKYLKNTADEMKTKVIHWNTASETCGDMIDSDPKEFSGSDGEMGEDGSQQSEDSAPEMDTHFYSSHHESGEHCISEKLSGSDKETGGEAAFACGREFHY